MVMTLYTYTINSEFKVNQIELAKTTNLFSTLLCYSSIIDRWCTNINSSVKLNNSSGDDRSSRCGAKDNNDNLLMQWRLSSFYPSSVDLIWSLFLKFNTNAHVRVIIELIWTNHKHYILIYQQDLIHIMSSSHYMTIR